MFSNNLIQVLVYIIIAAQHPQCNFSFPYAISTDIMTHQPVSRCVPRFHFK